MLEALVARHALLLLLGEQPPDEVLALLADILEGLGVELPVAVFDVLERGHVVGAGEGREAGEQDVGQHADRPHVRVEADSLALHDLGRRELGRARRDLDELVRVELRGEAEVDDLDVGALRGLAHDVLGFYVCTTRYSGVRNRIEFRVVEITYNVILDQVQIQAVYFDLRSDQGQIF